MILKKKYNPPAPKACWEIVAVNQKTGVAYVKESLELEDGSKDDTYHIYYRESQPYDKSQMMAQEDGKRCADMVLGNDSGFMKGEALFGKDAVVYQYPDIRRVLKSMYTKRSKKNRG